MDHWKGYGPDNLLGETPGVAPPGASAMPRSGALTYEPYYGLQTKPFSLSTDPRMLYRSPSHAAVLDDLVAAIRRREGIIVLTGAMGTGKTTVCRAAIYQLDRKTFTTFVPDPGLSREDLLRMLLVGFGEVSVNDLKQGRLKGIPRADLGCQVYEFLTSLESVDAFAVLVIDEAQHLAGPVLDEIRALSEMEAGRRLLQIVLVGQPELRARLKLPEMEQIAQRVTTMCELAPLSRDGVSGYVSHRVAVAGGARDRVEFSPAALDLAHEASGGIPRLLNRICDRALHYGHLERAAHIGQALVARALRDLHVAGFDRREDLDPSRASAAAPDPPSRMAPPGDVPVQPRQALPQASPGELFGRTAGHASSTVEGSLRSLLDLPPVTRQAEPDAATPVAPARHEMRRRAASRPASWRRALASLGLPMLAMTVMLGVGGLAVAGAGMRTGRVDLPPVPAPPQAPEAALEPRRGIAAPVASSLPAEPTETWVVQAAAFSDAARASAMVERLADDGFPAYLVEGSLARRGLTMVRLGPYQSAGEADAIREHLRSMPDYEGAFVRNLTVEP